uniref:BHLH domain-containing protein n=1 Tax=Kalanchoe fedtschenkoi TaxID=63787 RepID=A0A7N0V6Q7_KALFE
MNLQLMQIIQTGTCVAMYEETACFDPNPIADEGAIQVISNDLASIPPHGNMESSIAIPHFDFDENVKFPVDEFFYKSSSKEDSMVAPTNVVASSAVGTEFQQQMAYDVENCYYGTESDSRMQEAIHEVNQALSYEQSNWVASGDYEVQDMCYSSENQQQMLQDELVHNGQGIYTSSSVLDVPHPSAPDLLHLLHLPRSPSSASFLPNSTISFVNASQSSTNFQNGAGLMDAASSSAMFYDPLLHLNLPPQPPIFKDLFQSLPHGFNLPVPMTGSLFARMDEMERSRGLYHDVDGHLIDDGVLEFTADMPPQMVKGRNGKLKPFATERDRRDNLNNKYTTLKSLIPSPKKTDRASIVEDAIEYIKELTRTINELKVLVEKKRRVKERMKMLKTEASPDPESSSDVKHNSELNEPLRSSWLQRKSKDTEVDVRIIDDELTVKLSQRKKANCLLTMSKILEELQLDLQHVSGGQVGDFYSFVCNTKIGETSCVYAGGIAKRLIEGVERQQAGLGTNKISF